MMQQIPFDFDNLTGRPSGPFVRLGALLSSGIRSVQQHIKPYARAWQQHNIHALEDDGPLWVVLGDSMAQGVGASNYDMGWPGQLLRRMQAAGKDYRLVNLSQSGARIRDVLDMQLPALHHLDTKPALITVMIGSNDFSRKKYRVHAAFDYQELLDTLPEGSVIANLQGGGLPAQLAGLLRDAAPKHNYVIADVRKYGPRTWRGRTAADHFHPNDKGYAELTNAFSHALDLPS